MKSKIAAWLTGTALLVMVVGATPAHADGTPAAHPATPCIGCWVPPKG